MKKIKLTTPMNELTVSQKRRLCRYGIEFCRKKFGAPLSKMPISYSIATLPGNQDFYGQYSPDDNQIHIFSRNTETIKQFIMTFIHEYVHSTQPIKEHYNRLLNIYGYDEHPYEIEAETGASNYYSKFWSGFKNSYHFNSL